MTAGSRPAGSPTATNPPVDVPAGHVPAGHAPAGDLPAGEPDLLTVHILGLPIPLMARAQEHNSDLTRELTLIGEGMRQRGDTAGLPARLVTLVQQLSAPYSAFTAEQEQQLETAMRDRVPTIDLVYRLPSSAVDAARALGQILDEADDYCRAGRHLLTLATPADLVAYRRWFLGQFLDQAAGRPPVPWHEYQLRHGPWPAGTA